MASQSMRAPQGQQITGSQARPSLCTIKSHSLRMIAYCIGSRLQLVVGQCLLFAVQLPEDYGCKNINNISTSYPIRVGQQLQLQYCYFRYIYFPSSVQFVQLAMYFLLKNLLVYSSGCSYQLLPEFFAKDLQCRHDIADYRNEKKPPFIG